MLYLPFDGMRRGGAIGRCGILGIGRTTGMPGRLFLLLARMNIQRSST
ncbi:hypothetical protein ACU635_58635 [[Actinomadura] parvosata]